MWPGKRRYFVTVTVSLILGLFVAAAGCTRGRGPQPQAPGSTLGLTSSVVSEGHPIPTRFTCDGEDVSPALEFTGIPEGTRTLAVILDDPDAPGRVFTHWLLWNVPPGTTKLPTGLPTSQEVLDGARQGRNDFGSIGYGGPCPPRNSTHTYRFRVFAADTTLKVEAGAGVQELQQALDGHILGAATLTAQYGR